jgi:KaiC/GvpD/RAD55 family RecA-like ATPase
MVIKRITTGVPGLDEVFKGGIRENSSVLISGGPGTGKSIVGMQFILEGAKKGEPGLFILYDADQEEYLDYAEELGIPLREHVKKGAITILRQPMLLKKPASLAAPLAEISKNKIRRVVLDSLTMFSYIHVSDERDYRKKIVDFLTHMDKVTLLATSEASGSNIDEVNFKAEDFLFDGVIFLTKVRQEASFERVLHVSKMRGQDHLINVFPFFIEKGGVKVYPDQLPFALMSNDEAKKTVKK